MGAGSLRLASDRFGLTGALGGVHSRDIHRPGVVVPDLAVVLTDDGKTISAIETLRRRDPALFGEAASESDPTASRTLEAIVGDELALDSLFDALATARAPIWGRRRRRVGTTLDGSVRRS